MANSLVSIKEAARLIQVGSTTIQRWIDKGAIKAHRTVGGHRRILKNDLIRFANQHSIPIFEEKEEGSVLIIDDDSILVQVLVENIRRIRPNIKILTADSGFKAGSMINEYLPDLVLLDIRMPGMNGIDVCRLIKENEKTRGTTIIGITAYNDPDVINSMKNAGAESVLLKPIKIEKLTNIVEDIFPKIRQ